MPRNPMVDFKAVKAAVSMEQVLDRYGLLDGLKRAGDSLSGPCPIHNGSNPTQFRVSLGKNLWNCFSDCKGGGNVLDFIAKMDGVTIHAAALKAVDWFGLDCGKTPTCSEGKPSTERSRVGESRQADQEKSKPFSSEGPNPPLKFRLDKLDQKHAYLFERGLTSETIEDFGIGYCSKGMMIGRIAIPINDSEGRVVAYAGRWPGEPPEDKSKYKLPPGFRKALELFNIDRAIQEPPETPLVIVEGFFDAMKLHQLGCRKVVALMGSTLSPPQEELIRKHTNRNSHIIVILDEDEAGKFGRQDIAARLSQFAYVRIHMFEKPDMQPEHLTAEELANVLG